MHCVQEKHVMYEGHTGRVNENVPVRFKKAHPRLCIESVAALAGVQLPPRVRNSSV